MNCYVTAALLDFIGGRRSYKWEGKNAGVGVVPLVTLFVKIRPWLDVKIKLF